MDWTLRLAPHLGYVPPEFTVLFRHLAGENPVDHVRFAAAEGFAGIFDPFVAARPTEQRRALEMAVKDSGLDFGCVLSVPITKVLEPLWSTPERRDELLGHVGDALAVAKVFGSNNLAVLLFGNGEDDVAVQRHRAVDALRRGADLAARQGANLAIEPMKGMPGMLLSTFAEGLELVREVGHPNVKLIYDTAHVADMGEDPLQTLIDGYDDISVVQLADSPGRGEIGSGNIDFAPILEQLLRKGHKGLIELEHGWLEPGAEAERRGIERLRALDEQVRQALATA